MTHRVPSCPLKIGDPLHPSGGVLKKHTVNNDGSESTGGDRIEYL